jgi:hypothetical protein
MSEDNWAWSLLWVPQTQRATQIISQYSVFRRFTAKMAIVTSYNISINNISGSCCKDYWGQFCDEFDNSLQDVLSTLSESQDSAHTCPIVRRDSAHAPVDGVT